MRIWKKNVWTEFRDNVFYNFARLSTFGALRRRPSILCRSLRII